MFEYQFDDKLELCWHYIFDQCTINEVPRWHTIYLLKSFFFILHQKLKRSFHTTKKKQHESYTHRFSNHFKVNRLVKITFKVGCPVAYLSWNLNTLKEKESARKRRNLNGSWDTVASRAMFLFNRDISIYQGTLFIVSEGPQSCLKCNAK